MKHWFLAMTFAALGCAREDDDTRPATPAGTMTLSLDCTATSTSCTPLTIEGDPAATLGDGRASPVRGHADASLRRDPSSATIWMGYSWLHPFFEGGRFLGTGVDTHLARSDDGGRSWRAMRTLWRADPDARDASGRPGHTSSETVSLAPRGDGRWYSARMAYFTPDEGGPQVSSFTIRVAAAASPDQLAAAPEAVLGGALTDASWQPDVNLAALDGSLSGCTFFDAGLLYHQSRLYMAVQCALYRAGGEDVANEFVAVFSTDGDGPPRQWRWRYLGPLAGRAEAVALGGENLLQTDIARARDGSVLVIFSPSAPPTGGHILAQHFGCRAVAVASLDPPRLARDATGALDVRANITALDLRAPEGTPASCGYDPDSETGLVLARREDQGGLRSTLFRTGVRP